MTQDNTTIEERRFDDIQTWISTVQGTNLPEVLQGIYFMDGNKLQTTITKKIKKGAQAPSIMYILNL